jgi:hypothetical protein
MKRTTTPGRITAEDITSLAKRVDLRYFDCSPENLSAVTTAGEQIRRSAAREKYAAENTIPRDVMLNLLETTAPLMDDRDRYYTFKALLICEALTRDYNVPRPTDAQLRDAGLILGWDPR